jgi:hypothetical protein
LADCPPKISKFKTITKKWFRVQIVQALKLNTIMPLDLHIVPFVEL